VRDQYRAEFLRRFDALTRPPSDPGRRQWPPNAPLRGRFQPPSRASARAKAVGHGGLASDTARAVLAGLLRFPELIAAHSEAIAALPLADKAGQRMLAAMLDAAMAHGALDPGRLDTILTTAGVASLAEKLRLERGLAFSFTRRDADPERASRDLVLVIDTLAARPGLDAALEAATARLKEDGDEAAFREQQRLREAQREAERQLSALIEGDG
jgi:DNA primase